jgi:hypothetical protein
MTMMYSTEFGGAAARTMFCCADAGKVQTTFHESASASSDFKPFLIDKTLLDRRIESRCCGAAASKLSDYEFQVH